MESYRSKQNDTRRYSNGNGSVGVGSPSTVTAWNKNGAYAPAAIVYGRPKNDTANRILQRLDPLQHKRLFRSLKRVDLKKDQFLYQQGQRLEFLYFPENSVISKFHILEDGRTIEVEMIGHEGALGAACVFNSPTAINCSQVCVKGTALRVELDIVQAEARNSSALNDLLNEQMCRQLANLSQKVICNTFHHVEQRLCTWLLLLDERCSSEYLTMTQEHMARALGVHRPSVTYIAQAMRNKKLIDYVRGRIYLRDRRGLEETACVCYSEMRTER